MTINIKNNVLLASENHKDEWGEEVLGKVTGCNDLVAGEAMYHSPCMAKFNKKKKLGEG